MSLAAASPRSRDRTPSTTVAPMRAKQRAVSLPIPVFSPVTNTIFPSKDDFSKSFSRGTGGSQPSKRRHQTKGCETTIQVTKAGRRRTLWSWLSMSRCWGVGVFVLLLRDGRGSGELGAGVGA
jgi:hypothetical protein